MLAPKDCQVPLAKDKTLPSKVLTWFPALVKSWVRMAKDKIEALIGQA